jgi:hypothetical protein
MTDTCSRLLYRDASVCTAQEEEITLRLDGIVDGGTTLRSNE